MKILGKVKYNGSNYHGWQKQLNDNSIQTEIEKVLSQILNEPISIVGSGRTDAGVHALGQTFHFDCKDLKYPEDEFLYRINMMLPADIQVLSLEKIDGNNGFHARFSATGKEYEYRLSLNAKDPFRYDRCWMLKVRDFDMSLFKEALNKFIGVHNFKNFTSKEDDKDNYIREIFEINVGFDKENDEIVVRFIGNGFMRYQIRFMMGAAVAVAIKKEDLSYIDKKLDSDKKRSIVSYKGHPQGLYLAKVNYK